MPAVVNFYDTLFNGGEMKRIIYTFICGLTLLFPTINHANQLYIGADISYITFDQKEFN